ncbi:MAG TPA: insulinase family protein [Gammaproteobacteria bacterium]|nr:insulinase family protein [Gammaproteobacteria bacterium]
MKANRPIFDLPCTEHDLANGLKVIAIRAGAPDVVNLQIPVHTGSRNEVEPGKSGFAHFFEHMMFRGTRDYPPELYQAEMTRAGADQNAYTTDDFTNYHVTFTKPDLDTMLALEADRFQHLHLEEQGFRTEALAVKGEYLKNYSDPTEKMEEVLRETAFNVHPYRHTTMGFFADIEAMPEQIDYAREFFARWYRPNNATMLLTGDIDPDAAIARVEQHWSGWQAGDYSLDIPPEPTSSGPYYRHIHWETPTQPWVMVAFRGPRFSVENKAMAAMDFIRELYFSPQSDLYERVVVERQQADELFTDFSDHEDPYLLVVAARLTDEQHAQAVTEAILEACSQAASERVEAPRLDAVRDRMRYGFSHSLSEAESIGDVLAGFMRFERSPNVLNRLFTLYDSLTADDLREAAGEHFVSAGRTIVSLSHQANLGLRTMAEKVTMPTPPGPSPSAVQTVLLPTKAPLVDFDLVFKAGAANDPPGKRGLAMLTAMLIADGGSEARPRRAIQDALYPLAADVGVDVDKEMTAFSGEVHRDRLDAYYATLRELLLTPGWRKSDFERVKTRLINAIRTDLRGDNDEELGKEALYEWIYGGLEHSVIPAQAGIQSEVDAAEGRNHPYAHLNSGAVADLQKLTLDDCRSFYEQHYTTGNLMLGLGGGYPEDFVDRMKRDFGVLTTDAKPAVALPPPPPIERREALIVAKETPAVAVSFGQPIDVRRGDPDWVALWLARAWLGEHRSSVSHLYQRIRELRGMNYGDYAYIEYFPEGMFRLQPAPNLARRQQIFQVWLRPLRDNADAVFALRLALYELEKLINNGLSVDAFKRTRDYLHKFVALMVKSPARRLGYDVDSAYYGIPDFVDYVRDGLAKLNAEAVNAALKRHLDTSRMKFVFVAENAEDLKTRLVNDTPSRMHYNVEKPADVVAEDEQVGKLPLRFDADAVRVVAADHLFE